jgi:5-methylcytosine-specific restriction enzyme subunit McrC
MLNPNKKIQVFEHQTIYYGREYDSIFFKEKHFIALAKLNEYHKNKYFTIVHKGIKFSQYVGVIQIDDLCIEILPKTDNSTDDKKVWQKALIEMLKVTKKLNVDNVGQANVNKQNIHLLDIYFDWFLKELQLLIRRGLVKKYYKEKGNIKTLKGKLEFAEHINKNLIHKERFFTSHQVYEKDHLVHQILSQALDIVEEMSNGSYFYSKCKSIKLDFPEVNKIRATEVTFSTIPNTRKTLPYKTALEIARLIILNYAPNISSGKENMLALLFDMNSLWEDYILIRLKNVLKDRLEVFGQKSKLFWNGITIRPDIVIQDGLETYIIDTKWKNLNGSKPSTNDLRQMYVYNDYWRSTKAILLYPSNSSERPKLINFEGLNESQLHHQCGLGQISIFNNDNSLLNTNIGEEILDWFQQA